MNRKGFFATIAAAFGAGLGSKVTARASGNGVQIPEAGGHPDPPPDWIWAYDNIMVSQGRLAQRLDAIQARLDGIDQTLAELNEAVWRLGPYISSLASEINTAVEDNDDVDQNASATNRTQIVASGGNVVAPGQGIGQCQNGG